MPVSPQDFALWSDLTGNPYPRTPAERMALAPQVHEFTRNVGRRGGPIMSPFRQAADVVGKAALAAGALAGAAYLGSKYLGGEGESFGKLSLDDEPGVAPVKAHEVDPSSQVVRASGDVTPPTAAQLRGQGIVPDQTAEAQAIKGLSPQKPTAVPSESKLVTQSQILSSSQAFPPGGEAEQLKEVTQAQPGVRDRADELISEYLGNVGLEQKQQARIDQSVAEYQAGIAGRGERVLKDVLKEGRQEGISPIGHASAQAAEAFRKSAAYEQMKQQYPALQDIQSPTTVEAPAGETPTPPVLMTGVQPSPQMRVAKTVETSPIVSMSKTPATAPVTESVGPTGSPTMKEIQELDQQLAISHGARASVAQRQAMRDQILAERYTQKPTTATVEPATQHEVIETVSPGPYRVAKEGRITPNQYLSEVSQKLGALASYPVPAKRSETVTNVTFYPGGEIGVTMPTKKYGEKEYAYATSDPYRLALGEYAEEGFPTGMGSIGGLVGHGNVAHQLGLQKTVRPGGTIATNQPEYSGLMDEAQIAKKLKSRSENVRSQAQYHADTKAVMQALQERAAARRA